MFVFVLLRFVVMATDQFELFRVHVPTITILSLSLKVHFALQTRNPRDYRNN